MTFLSRGLAAACIALSVVPAWSQPAAEPPARIEIKAKAIENFESRDPSRKRFGALEFRGGLELSFF